MKKIAIGALSALFAVTVLAGTAQAVDASASTDYGTNGNYWE